jgi:exodeoxyribonuclease-3
MAAAQGWSTVTANVNGIRAALRRGGMQWLADAAPDVICLQEVRATHEQLHEVLAEGGLDHLHVAHSPSAQLGRSGVAVISREPQKSVVIGLGHEQFDQQGRWVEAVVPSPFGPVTVVSVYVHTGEADTPRQSEKYEFLEVMSDRVDTLLKRAKRNKGHVLISGDINIAHQEVDIKNWKGNLKNAGFLPDERAYLDRWMSSGLVDLGRALGGPGPGPYTWWSWRGKAFDTDGGWRIDYTLASAGLAAQAQTAIVGRAPTYAERWSDHAPLTVSFAPSR